MDTEGTERKKGAARRENEAKWMIRVTDWPAVCMCVLYADVKASAHALT